MKETEVCDAFAEAWWHVTRDSVVVDAQAVLSASQLAGYLSKYFAKGMEAFEPLKRMGFSRRWSRSRGWPGGQLRMRGTVEEKWSGSQFTKVGEFGLQNRRRFEIQQKRQGRHPLFERVGDDLAVALADRKGKRRLSKMSTELLRKGEVDVSFGTRLEESSVDSGGY